jgi:hypothetical protein
MTCVKEIRRSVVMLLAWGVKERLKEWRGPAGEMGRGGIRVD